MSTNTNTDVVQRAESALETINNETWYKAGPPWGNGETVFANSDDPHAGTIICLCDPSLFADVDEGDDRIDVNATFIANAPDVIRELVQELKRERAKNAAVSEFFTFIPPPESPKLDTNALLDVTKFAWESGDLETDRKLEDAFRGDLSSESD